MAVKKKTYVSKAIPNSIRATSRISLKKGETFYTVEYTEERLIPDVEGVDINKERNILWDDVNAEVDKQAEDIEKLYTR